jgi:16S rRNA (guanine527-N7)-methyltransferase
MPAARGHKHADTCARTVSPEQIRDELAMYGFSASAEFADRVRLYADLLLRWNQRISLTAVTNATRLLRFHFGESLYAISALGIREGRLADFGSGAGFPGAPLAMALPRLNATLIEANTKKAAFLAELKRTIGLDNAAVFSGRAERMRGADKFDFITARAVGDYGSLLDWSRQRLSREGSVALWLGAEGAAQIRSNTLWKWDNPVPIPRTTGRFILRGSPAQ